MHVVTASLTVTVKLKTPAPQEAKSKSCESVEADEGTAQGGIVSQVYVEPGEAPAILNVDVSTGSVVHKNATSAEKLGGG